MKRQIACLLTAAITFALFTGCVSQENFVPTPVQTASQQETVILDFMLNSPEMTEQYYAMAHAYKAYQHDIDIKMDIRQNDYGTVLQTRLNAGEVPDLFITNAYNDNKVFKNYVYRLNDQPFIKSIEPALLSGVTLNGSITGCPFVVQSHSFIYSKELFAKAGITVLPVTIDEYRTACEKLNAIGVTPFSTGFADWWVLPQTVYPSMSDAYSGDYKKLFQDVQNKTLRFGDLEQVEFALDLLDMIKSNGGGNAMQSNFETQCADFAAQRVAIIHQGSWAEQTIMKTNPDLKIGYLGAPRLDGKGVIAVDSNLTFRVYKDSPRLEQTLSFLNWLITSKFGKAWIPESIKQISPQIGAVMPDTQLSAQTGDAIEQKQTCPWWIFGVSENIEQPFGIALQQYAAGNADRAQTKEEITRIFTDNTGT